MKEITYLPSKSKFDTLNDNIKHKKKVVKK